MTRFATIKKLPTRRSPRREARTASRYANNEANQLRIASSVSETSNFTDSLKRLPIRRHLLSVKSVRDPRGLLAVFASQRKIVSSAMTGNVPPRKKVQSVYRIEEGY
jgi:hypothetical protein